MRFQSSKLFIAALALCLCYFCHPTLAACAAEEKILHSVVPGALESKRTALLHDIYELEKDGAGIKPYLTAFEGIETAVKEGKDEQFIKVRVDSLNQAIQNQLEATRKTAWAAGNDPIWTPWARHVSRKVLTHWHPSRNSPTYKVKVLFGINKDGSLKYSKVSLSSGNKVADQEALAAVKAAAPFEGWPAEDKDNDVKMEQEFTYNGRNDSKMQ